MTANLFSGLGQDYSGTIPAGQVGFWCSHGTANSFDNFYIRDLAGPFEIDGRWFGNCGDIQVDSGNNNVLEFQSTESVNRTAVRRGFRGGKFVMTTRFKWNNSAIVGMIPRWIGPSDYVYVSIQPSDGKARLIQRVAGDAATLVRFAKSPRAGSAHARISGRSTRRCCDACVFACGSGCWLTVIAAMPRWLSRSVTRSVRHGCEGSSSGGVRAARSSRGGWGSRAVAGWRRVASRLSLGSPC